MRLFQEATQRTGPARTKIIALIPLLVAYACKRERGKGLATAQNTLETLQMLNSSGMNNLFIDSVEQALLATFPHDKQIQTFLRDVQHSLK